MASPRQIEVFLLPSLAEPDLLAGKVVVIIDVLRATTTIVHALAAGAAQVIPCLEVADAHQIAAQHGGGPVLGGERGGKQIAGFDLGNSPREYGRDRVAGRTVVFTTTNGTRAMIRCRAARRVLIGAFVNFTAVCRALAEEPQIALICAGTNGDITREDVLFAGAVVDELGRSADASLVPALNDQAQIAADAWRTCVHGLTNCPLGTALRASSGGRNLIEIGQDGDIDIAAQIDKFDFVPELDLVAWRIVRP